MSKAEQKQAQHTKGPWGWQQMGEWFLMGQWGMRPVVIGARKGGLVLRDERDLLVGFDPSHPDAHLIAAAPDLLAALKWFVANSSDDQAPASIHNSAAEFAKARAAIAKAEGRQS